MKHQKVFKVYLNIKSVLYVKKLTDNFGSKNISPLKIYKSIKCKS